MSDWKPPRGSSKRTSRMLFAPFRFLGAVVAEVWGSVREIGGMLVPQLGRGRRNRDFDQAGRVSRRVPSRVATDAAFRQGERERRRERREANRESRRLERATTEEAIEYREALERRALDVSRGEIVNHLAKVNARSRASKPQSKADESEN